MCMCETTRIKQSVIKRLANEQGHEARGTHQSTPTLKSGLETGATRRLTTSRTEVERAVEESAPTRHRKQERPSRGGRRTPKSEEKAKLLS